MSDWEMPRLSGPDLCRAVRASDLPGYVYIILVTSHDSPQEAVEGLSAGADDFVSKPFEPSVLTARVRTGERIVALETREIAIFAMAKLAESWDPQGLRHALRSRCRGGLRAAGRGVRKDPRPLRRIARARRVTRAGCNEAPVQARVPSRVSRPHRQRNGRWTQAWA